MGLQLVESCQQLNVYGSTITEGMRAEIHRAQERGIPVVYEQEPVRQVRAPGRAPGIGGPAGEAAPGLRGRASRRTTPVYRYGSTITEGMRAEIRRAQDQGIPVIFGQEPPQRGRVSHRLNISSICSRIPASFSSIEALPRMA